MPTAVLSLEQKTRVRAHLGYPNVAPAATFALGVPANLEPLYIVESAMNKILPEALPELERILGVLDAIESQQVEDHELLAVQAIGEITVNLKEQEQLDSRYDQWVGKLENFLIAPRNPYDKRLAQRGRLNVSVMR